MFFVPPVCSNCGANDFVWANDLKTGGPISGGTLSLRARGELAMGTRICRACGHADLFLKDPSILRMPHTWRPGEFVPIPARPHEPAPPVAPPPVPPAHHAPPPPAEPAPPTPESTPVAAPPPPPPEPVAPAEATPEPESTAEAVPDPDSMGAKKPTRKRAAKAKSTESLPPPPSS